MYVLAAAHTATHSGGNGWLGPLLLILVGVLIGRLWGRRAALRQLGEYEFRGRWANINKIRRWLPNRDERERYVCGYVKHRPGHGDSGERLVTLLGARRTEGSNERDEGTDTGHRYRASTRRGPTVPARDNRGSHSVRATSVRQRAPGDFIRARTGPSGGHRQDA